MIICTSAAIALRCPNCGKMELKNISLFDFSGINFIRKNCSCGEELFNIYTKDKKIFWLQNHCIACDSYHITKINRNELWGTQRDTGFEIYCEESVLDIGYVGKESWIIKKIDEKPATIAEIAKEMGFTEYFKNPEVMYEILGHLYHLAESGNMYCQCGNHNIEIDIFPEHLEIYCEVCSTKNTIGARTEEDLKKIMAFTQLVLNKDQFSILDLNILKSFRKK